MKTLLKVLLNSDDVSDELESFKFILSICVATLVLFAILSVVL